MAKSAIALEGKTGRRISLKKMSHFGYWLNMLYRIFVYALLLDLIFVFLYPFLYMFVTSFMTDADLVDTTVKWVPRAFHYQNYIIAFKYMNTLLGLRNSLIQTGLSVLGHILSCSFIAYGLARYKFPGRNIMFVIVLFSFIIPAQTIIVPLYMNYSRMGWMNSILPLIVPTFFGFGLRGGLFVFIFRQFYMGIPNELEEAALIDGCGSFRTYLRIILPISRTSILVSAVLAMVWHWNDYFEPAVYITKPLQFPLPKMLPGMYAQMKLVKEAFVRDPITGQLYPKILNEAVVMAGTVIVILPLLLAYLLLQRYFMQGIERTGIVE